MRTKVRTTGADTRQPLESNGASSVQWLRADHIRIDPETQRQLRPEWVKHLAENFDPDKLGIIHVARRKDAFYAMDGQHRIFACRLRGEPTRLLECKVYDNLTKPDEARIFRGLNNQKAVALFDKFMVSLIDDPDCQAINKMVESVGMQVHNQQKDGCITAVKALQDVYFGKPFRSKEPTPWALARALRTLHDAWGTQSDAFTGPMITGAGAVHLRYGDEIDKELFARKLGTSGTPLRLMGTARQVKELTSRQLWRCVAETMVNTYNKGLRKQTLPDFSR